MSLSPPPPPLGPALCMTEKYSVAVSGGENWGEVGKGCTGVKVASGVSIHVMDILL